MEVTLKNINELGTVCLKTYEYGKFILLKPGETITIERDKIRGKLPPSVKIESEMGNELKEFIDLNNKPEEVKGETEENLQQPLPQPLDIPQEEIVIEGAQIQVNAEANAEVKPVEPLVGEKEALQKLIAQIEAEIKDGKEMLKSVHAKIAKENINKQLAALKAQLKENKAKLKEIK